MRFRLRYLRHDLELSIGTFVIGRSAECQLSLDDPLVSRRHALLHVGQDEISLEDAGSRNGVMVNGVRLSERARLNNGDHVVIGAQEMTVAIAPDTDAPKRGNRLADTPTPVPLGPPTLMTLPAAQKSEPAPPSPLAPLQGQMHVDGFENEMISPPEEPTLGRPRRGEALKLLGGVADKALALGNPENAERLLQMGLQEVAMDLRLGRNVPSETVDSAARFAARLAAGTGKGSWGDYAVALYAERNVLPPAFIVDELYIAARRMRGFDLGAFRHYLVRQRTRSRELSPTERFVLQRLDGLEQLLATR